MEPLEDEISIITLDVLGMWNLTSRYVSKYSI